MPIDRWRGLTGALHATMLQTIGIAVTRSEHRGRAKTGLILNGIVIVVGIFRLSLGGGII